LDAVHAIKDLSPVHILKEIKLRVDELMHNTGRRHYLIVELDLNDTKFIAPIEKGGFGMDAQWIDEFHHALRVASGQEKSGYYSDFTGLAHLAKSYQDAYVYDGQYSHHRNKFFGVKADEAEGKQFIVFSQNHDQVGNRMLGERTSELVSFEMQKLLAGAVIVSPFLPMLFMGEEWSETNRFQYFVSHTGAELAEAVRKGRKEEFKAFHLEGEAPDPLPEETFKASKLQWQLLEEDRNKTMLQFYKTLIQLRKDHAALRNLDRKAVTVDFSEEDQTLFLHRKHDASEALCLMNFSKEPKTINRVKADEWTIILDSADVKWGGNGAANIEENIVRLRGESIVILTNGKSTDFIVTI
jgi:maltooligosyltrehalose trehalohydrolase